MRGGWLRLVDDFLKDGESIGAAEGLVAREQPVGERRQRELIGPLINLCVRAAHLFRGHVLGRSRDGPVVCEAFGQVACESEVDDLDEVNPPVSWDQDDVVGLEVEMDDALGVGGGQSIGDLPNDVQRCAWFEGRPRSGTPGEGPTSQQLHDQERDPVRGNVEVQDLNDVGSRSVDMMSASRRKRARASGFPTRLGSNTLTATSERSLRWVATYTSPHPPPASSRSIR